jgi:hypothetical protein
MNLPHIEADEDFRSVVAECDRLLTVKGHDYTQGAASWTASNDHARLKNFYRHAERLGLPARKVLAVYLAKHLDAIETFLAHGRVESEPIEGRICDAINYLLLLAKMVRVEQRDDEDDLLKRIREAQSDP